MSFSVSQKVSHHLKCAEPPVACRNHHVSNQFLVDRFSLFSISCNKCFCVHISSFEIFTVYWSLWKIHTMASDKVIVEYSLDFLVFAVPWPFFILFLGCFHYFLQAMILAHLSLISVLGSVAFPGWRASLTICFLWSKWNEWASWCTELTVSWMMVADPQATRETYRVYF
jgi:hypothetical protein